VLGEADVAEEAAFERESERKRELHIYMYISIHIYTSAYICIHICICVCMYTGRHGVLGEADVAEEAAFERESKREGGNYIYICIYIHIYIYIYTYAYICIHICICVCVCTGRHGVLGEADVAEEAAFERESERERELRIYMYTYIYIYTNAYICIHICMCVCIYTGRHGVLGEADVAEEAAFESAAKSDMTLLRVSGPSENDYEVVSMLCVAVCCRVLQCVAGCCSVLQCVAGCCRVLPCIVASHDAAERFRAFRERLQGSQYVVCCRVLQGVAVCCSLLQDVAVCCRVLQRFAV